MGANRCWFGIAGRMARGYTIGVTERGNKREAGLWVTYTEVSTEFEDLSDVGSLGVIVHGYDGLPMMLEDPYAYVEAALQAPPPPISRALVPEEPEQASPSPDDVSSLEYPEEMDDDPEEIQLIILLTEIIERGGGSSRDYADDEKRTRICRYITIIITSTITTYIILITTSLDTISTTTITTTYHTSTHQGIYRHDESCRTIDLLFSTSIENTTIKDTSIRDKKLCIVLGPRYEIGESSSTATTRPTRGLREDYVFVATLDTEIRQWFIAQQTKIGELRYRPIRQIQLTEQLTLLIHCKTQMQHDRNVMQPKAEIREDSHDSGTGVRRTERATHECTYPDFMKCKPLKFKGTEGVVGLT
ncbi:hypothetical protein Tco_0651093 [Tanacetum coccineum]